MYYQNLIIIHECSKKLYKDEMLLQKYLLTPVHINPKNKTHKNTNLKTPF